MQIVIKINITIEFFNNESSKNTKEILKLKTKKKIITKSNYPYLLKPNYWDFS